MTSNIFFLPKSFPYFHGFRFYISTTNNIKCIIDDRLGNGNDFEETLRTRAGTEECKIDFFMSFFFGNQQLCKSIKSVHENSKFKTIAGTEFSVLQKCSANLEIGLPPDTCSRQHIQYLKLFLFCFSYLIHLNAKWYTQKNFMFHLK